MLTRTVLSLTLFITSILVGLFALLHTYRFEITTKVLEKAAHADHVTIEKIHGFFPFTVTAEGIRGVRSVEQDEQTFITAQSIAFDMNPLSLLLGTVTLNYLKVEKLEYTLLPTSDAHPHAVNPGENTKNSFSLPLAFQIYNATIDSRINYTPVKIEGSLGQKTDARFDVKDGAFAGTLTKEDDAITMTLSSHPMTVTGDIKDLNMIPFTASHGEYVIKGQLQNKENTSYLLDLWDEEESLYSSLSYHNGMIKLESFTYDKAGAHIKLEKPVTLDTAHGLSLDHAVLLMNQEKCEVKNLSIGETLSGTATFNLKTLRLVEQIFPQLGEHKLQGSLILHAQLLGSIDSPQINVSVNGQNIKSEKVPLRSPLNMKATLKGDLTAPTLQSTIEAGPEMTLKSLGKLSSSATDLTHNVHLPLKIIRGILPAGDHIDGKITGTLKTTGPLTNVKTSGRLQLQNGLYQNQIIGLHIKNLQGSIDLNQSLVTTTLHAQDDFKGKLQITGSGDFSKNTGELKAHFTQFYLGQSDLFTGKTDGYITVDLAKKTVQGELLLDPVVVDIDQLTPTSTPKLFPLATSKDLKKNAKSAEKDDGGQKNSFFFDIHLKPRKYVIVRGFGIESTWLGEMKLHGHTPDFIGSFMLNKGTIDITGRVLNFTRGKITFDHKIDEPFLDLEITKKIDSYDVYVQLQGRPKSPKFTFLSAPALTQEEVIALIMLGRKSAASSLGQLLEISSSLESLSNHGQSDSIFSKFRRTFGIEALEIKKRDQSSPSESPQALSIRKSITPNVAVVVEQGLSSTDEETKSSKATIEASLTENLNLEVDATTKKSAALGFSWIKRY